MRSADAKFVRYSGMSMWPGFQEGDLLEVAPIAISKLRRGDIVVFHYGDGSQLVHRVVRPGRSIRTRGDALAKLDCFSVEEEQLVGKVIRRYRLREETLVPGGWRGHWLGKGYHLASRLNPARPSRGGGFARMVRGKSMWMLARFWERGEIRRVQLAGQTPVTIKYWGKRAIGRKDAVSGEWLIYWPWCLILPTAKTQITFSHHEDIGPK